MPKHQKQIVPLSPRELEVLVLVAKGLANKQIADALGIRVSTVKHHLTSIFTRLGVDRRIPAINEARVRGML